MLSKSEDLTAKIEEYRDRCYVIRRCHYKTAKNFERYNMLLGVPVVMITAIVGTSIFGSLQSNPSALVKIVLGVVSISATILSSLQTYLGYSEKSADHKEAGAQYGIIWRAFDVLITELKLKGDAFAEVALNELKRIISILDEVGQKSPKLPDAIYQKARIDQKNKPKTRQDYK